MNASLGTEVKEKTALASTVLWNDVPKWLQDNHYIHRGYRRPTNSYRRSAASLAYLHNESVNIYTHLIGALAAAGVGIRLYASIRPRFDRATAEDAAVFACYFLGAVACLGMSAAYHTISNHSEAVAKFGNRLDYIGIVVLIWGSTIPSIYYGFAADPAWIRFYWAMITTLGAATLAVVSLPNFRSPAWRPFRAAMFVAMGLSAVVPVLHGCRLYGAARLQRQMGLAWVVGQGALYIAGAAIYAARVPERWRPGAFDLWGSSHQIFHVLVLLAAAAHLVGLLKAFDYAHTSRGAMAAASDLSWPMGGS